jgi:TRAP-type C4-dicarboxylate transport system substrate-binding protein
MLGRRAGPLGLVLTAYDVWRRLPPKQRQQILDVARKHGPRVAARAMNGARRPPKR